MANKWSDVTIYLEFMSIYKSPSQLLHCPYLYLLSDTPNRARVTNLLRSLNVYVNYH